MTEAERIAAQAAAQKKVAGLTVGTQVPPIPVGNGQADDANVVINEATVKALAQLVPETLAGMFQQELATAITNARAEVNREAGLALAVARKAITGSQKMDPEQQADWLRCRIARLMGQPDQGVPDAQLDADGLVTQTLTITAGTSGAYLVPTDFVAEIEKRALTPSVVWPMVRKRPTNRSSVTKPEVTGYVTVNKGTAAKVNSATVTDVIAETVPTFSQLTWTMRDFDARMPAKLDLLAESPMGVYEELVQLAADGFTVQREYEVMRGTGSAAGRPIGIFDAASSVSTVAIAAAPTVANILDLIGNLPKRYAMGASALMGRQTLMAVISALAQNVRAAEFLIKHLPAMDDQEYVEEGKILVGDFNYYVVYHAHLMQLITGIAAERKTQEIVLTDRWDGQVTIEDAFRIGTTVTY